MGLRRTGSRCSAASMAVRASASLPDSMSRTPSGTDGGGRLGELPCAAGNVDTSTSKARGAPPGIIAAF
jgi:hypothetical protein